MTTDLATTTAADTPTGPGTTTRPTGSGVTPRLAARLAGIGYVLIFGLAIFANFLVREGLVVTGDPATTAANIAGSIGLFRAGFVAFLAIVLLDILISWALHVVFRGVNADLSLLTAWSRLVYTAFLGVALVFYLQAMRLLGGAEYLEVLGTGGVEVQAMLAMESFNDTWLIGLTAFGIHLVLLGVLVVRSRLAPTVLGVLLVAAGVAYVADTVAATALPEYQAVAPLFLILVAVPSMVGEGWLGLWLLFTRRLAPGGGDGR